MDSLCKISIIYSKNCTCFFRGSPFFCFMAKRQLFPKTFITSSVEHYTFTLNKRTVSIYLILVVFFVVIVLSLPFISMDVSTSARGVISAETARFDLNTPTSGFVIENRLKEGEYVRRGDTLLILDHSVLQKESNQLEARLMELNRFVNDLDLLVDDGMGEAVQLMSSRFQIAFLKFKTAHEKLKLKESTFQKIYDRQKQLFHLKVISKAEFEQDDANYQRALAETELFKKQAVAEWKEQLLSIEEERKRLLFRQKEIENELLRYTLIAPTAGELQHVVSLNVNQFVPAGLKVGDITPDSDLLAVCWVAPGDIGLIHTGMAGLFRVDAFNYNEWGSLDGKVSTISSDVYLVDSQPYFKVECRLEQDYLALKNGVSGTLKKGMTVQANFTVAKRTLYQLLYDKVDDWLNPGAP